MVSYKVLAVAAVLAAPALAVSAQEYPSRTIEFVIHAGVGGGTDLNARAIAAPLSEILGANIAVVSKQGGTGTVAMEYMMTRPADGYTIAMVNIGHAGTIARGNSPMEVADFAFLGRATSEPQVLYTACGRFETAETFLEAQREQTLSYGVTQVGGVDDISAFMLAQRGDLQTPRAVPFGSGGEVITNVIAGNVDVAALNPSEAETQVSSGEICPTLVVAPDRFSQYPDVPTARQIGIDVAFPTVRGVAVRADTPPEIIETLREAVAEAMASDAYRAFLDQNGLEYDSSVSTADEFAEEFVRLEEDMRSAMLALGYIQQ